MHPFRAAIEARDIDRAVALLSNDVVFRSPIVVAPYHGRAAVRAILGAVARVFDDFAYVREIGAANAQDHALVFRARIGEKELEGSDFLHIDANGAIDELMVMVRPLSGALALADAVKSKLASAKTA
jgi:hypothetical protein